MKHRSYLTAMVLLALAAAGQAADDVTAKLPLDALLETTISTSAKYDQQLSRAAASVTVITAEEIERYGWPSLADVLQATPGFYITENRDYTTVGMRGVGDSGKRVLLLVDGQPINDPIFGGAEISTLATDLGSVERIEIVRGPGSAVYGSNAMLGVINVITRSADATDGVVVSVAHGSQNEQAASLRAGKVFANGVHLTFFGNWQQKDGADLFFPDFDTPETNNGVARGRDYQDLGSLGLTYEKGNFRFTAFTHQRTKGIPAAAFDTV